MGLVDQCRLHCCSRIAILVVIMVVVDAGGVFVALLLKLWCV